MSYMNGKRPGAHREESDTTMTAAAVGAATMRRSSGSSGDPCYGNARRWARIKLHHHKKAWHTLWNPSPANARRVRPITSLINI